MLLAAEIKMRINVGCCAVVRVSQPLLYLFHRHSVCKKQTGTAMAKVMIAYVLQAVFFQKLTEFRRDIVRSEELSYFVHADVVVVFVYIAIAAQSPLLVLVELQPPQCHCHLLHQRKYPVAGLRFHFVVTDCLVFAVYLLLHDLVSNADSAVPEVDIAPLDTEDLAAAKSVICRKKHVNVYLALFRSTESLLGNRDTDTEAYSIIGELLTLEYLLRKGIDAKWQGAEGGVQDVQSKECNYEVKSTTSRYGYEVTINSIYQLKNKGADLKLVFCRFEKSSVGTDLNSVISDLISLGYSESLLEKAMEANGFEKGCTARSKKYRLIEMKLYNVDDSFPAISESSFKGDVIPKNILRINYTVDLSGLPCENIFETEQNR